jgi:hypothetical protein
VPGAGLVALALAAIPKPDAEHSRGDLESPGQQLAGVDRASADLTLTPSRFEQVLAVDQLREPLVIDEPPSVRSTWGTRLSAKCESNGVCEPDASPRVRAEVSPLGSSHPLRTIPDSTAADSIDYCDAELSGRALTHSP